MLIAEDGVGTIPAAVEWAAQARGPKVYGPMAGRADVDRQTQWKMAENPARWMVWTDARRVGL